MRPTLEGETVKREQGKGERSRDRELKERQLSEAQIWVQVLEEQSQEIDPGTSPELSKVGVHGESVGASALNEIKPYIREPTILSDRAARIFVPLDVNGAYLQYNESLS